MSRYTRAIRLLARMNALDANSAEVLMNAHEEDGGPGSGNHGHAGRPGQRGGSAPGGGGGGKSPSQSKSSGSTETSFKSSGRSGGFFSGKSGTTYTGPNGEKYKVTPEVEKAIREGNYEAKAITPERTVYRGGPANKKTSYTPATSLSPYNEKRSLATRDHKALQRLQSASGSPEGMKKALDAMKPGSMIRLNEPGYSLFVKGQDGNWEYRRYHGEPKKVTTDDIFNGIRGIKNSKTGMPLSPSEAMTAVSSPKKGEEGRSQYWDGVRAVANLEPNAGDRYEGKRYSFAQALKNGDLRARGVLKFPKEKGNKSSEYTKETVDDNGVIRSTGQATSLMPNGTGVTSVNASDLMNPNPDKRVYNSLQEHVMEDANGNLVLTPEREKLHQDIIQELFANAKKPGPGEQKVMTFMGGGSAAGKGTIQASGVANLPDKEHSPVIDADEMKKRIPEYVDTAFSDDHNYAASMGHEESSSLAGRAMRAAIANGYSFTLDGTGDGNPKKQVNKIKLAQANGYVVNGCYVTCPTEMAVKRNEGRSNTDEYNRLVPEAEVRSIHAKVSGAFEEVAKAMNSCKVYDTAGNKPVLIAEYKDGEKVFEDKKRFAAFIAKKSEGEIAKLAEERSKKS